MKHITLTKHLTLPKEQIIKENDIVVFDDIRGLPNAETPFISPDYVICIGNRGHVQFTYDGRPATANKGVVAVIYPNHELRLLSRSNDYQVTHIVVNASMLSEPLLRIIEQMRYRLEPYPRVELSDHQYEIIMDTVTVMRETSEIDIPQQRLYLVRQLEFLMVLLGYYRKVQLNERILDARVSTIFYNHLALFHKKHRDVAFYADKACLTPKHFSSVIKAETGHTATWWIHAQIISTAKIILLSRRDLTIQEVAAFLGFSDHATFSRYFHRETGFYPTEYRANN